MDKEYIATCGACGKDFDEIEINMMDYEIDLCGKCEKEHLKTLKDDLLVTHAHILCSKNRIAQTSIIIPF
ncbi:hypothetical protein AM499_08930 [Bacillus sp. FJAT-22090]|uniref:hypothetical protein n=1 Tax=Bacillus sp. FJAT-22090 TaxID=1581038 RepID=UPI0006AF4B70|nr:hypothetical protein [Bacillus sp. FJAT-22090]ALC85935.1 hypothetical protein AM499_08930 [Bacillus sp. FJAT-22090]